MEGNKHLKNRAKEEKRNRSKMKKRHKNNNSGNVGGASTLTPDEVEGFESTDAVVSAERTIAVESKEDPLPGPVAAAHGEPPQDGQGLRKMLTECQEPIIGRY